jgi:hypothetical protein
MTTKPTNAFIGEPVVYIIGLLGVALFSLAVLFVVGLIVLPIAAVAVVGILLFRHHQLQKLRIKITTPVTTPPPQPQMRTPLFSTEHTVEGFREAVDGVVLRYLEKPTGLYSCPALSQAFTTVATQLYIQESFHAPPAPPQAKDLITLARYQDQFEQWQHKTSDESTLRLFLDTVAETYMLLREYFPAYAFQQTSETTVAPFTTPLHITIEGDDAEALAGDFFLLELKEKHLFDHLREQIVSNAAKVESAHATPTFENLFADTALADFAGVQLPFELPFEQRFAGHWIIAPPGRGKTTLLHGMVLDDLAKDASLILIDSKGDLIEPVKNLQSLKDRLLLIEPDPDSAFALNPLDVAHASIVQVVSLIEYIMAGLLDAKFTALQSTLFRNVVPAIIEAIPNPTLDDFKRVMVKGLPSLENVNDHARGFFENRETGFHSKTYESTRKEVVWRLDYLMSNPTLRSMFSASHTKLDIGKEMDEGKVIIINNSKAILGDEGAEFFGRFFVALIARAAQQRAGKPAASKKPCFVYIDECQSVIAKDTRIPILLDECRSQKIALILSHQRTAQLASPVLDAVANCAIRMANSDDEAKYLSSKLRMDAEILQSLPRGTFGTYVRDLTPQGIQLKVSKVDLDALPKMTDAEFDAVRARMKADFASAPPSASDAVPAAAPPAERQATTAAPTSQPIPPEIRPTIASDPGEPADTW